MVKTMTACPRGHLNDSCSLQVQAHVCWCRRFYVGISCVCVQDWDALCIAELQAAQQTAGHQSVVLSTYPLGFDGEGAAAAVPDAAPATMLCAKEFDEAGLLRIKSRWVRPPWVCGVKQVVALVV